MAATTIRVTVEWRAGSSSKEEEGEAEGAATGTQVCKCKEVSTTFNVGNSDRILNGRVG
jgi:hypothetical protein